VEKYMSNSFSVEMLQRSQQTNVENGEKNKEFEDMKDGNGFTWETNADKREKKENSLW
jgi:hypothetical protein